ncbi:MAG: hypothetical protein R6V06_09410 [Kiritimatiellia bacterium]
MRNHSETGFVLPLVLVTTAVVAIISGAVFSYSIYATRAAGQYLTASKCRLSAQSGLEQTKIEILDEFKKYNQINPSSWQLLSWFDSYSSTSIGSGAYSYDLMQDTVIDDCNVSVIITDVQRSPASEARQFTDITFQSTGTATSPGGMTCSRTIEETVQYAMKRSRVFDYAYFVNNYGYFMGNGCSANGDIRANGNMTLDRSAIINGFAYAAANPAIGAAGKITVDGGNTTRHMQQTEYWHDNERAARPTSPTSSSSTEPYSMGYEARNGLYSYQEHLEMPFLGDLEGYRNIAGILNGTIKQQGRTLVNGCYDGPGPSGIENADDTGSIILDGTEKPIIIDGPVVVNGDVIIKGTVTGQGTIYAGRNIHIVGDVNYANPPVWPKPDNSPDKTTKKNQSKDMLGLIAKGNVVLGDYTSHNWLSSVGRNIKPPFVNGYECDPTDASIGYGDYFNGDYTARDGGEKINYRWDWEKKEYVPSGTEDRRYYESTVGNHKISELSQSGYLSNIDAVLFNNHALMGMVGACKFNGGFVCRDDGCIYTKSVRINWDIRLGSKSPDGMNTFIFMPLTIGTPRVIGWREAS